MPPIPKANADPADVDAKNPENPLGDVPVGGILGQPVAPPLPKPPKTYTESIPASTLIDIPCSYLYDRNGWADFKRNLNECGLTWNLPNWMTTIVRGGTEWK